MVEDLVDGESRLGGSFRGMKTLKSSGSSGIVTLRMLVCVCVCVSKLKQRAKVATSKPVCVGLTLLDVSVHVF